DGEDPDSYSRKVGSQAFQDYLENNSRDFIGFKIGLYKEELTKNPIRKAEVIREVVQSIGKIPDPIIRSVYAKEASGLLGIEENFLHASLNKLLLTGQKKNFNQQKDDLFAQQAVEELIPDDTESSFSEILRIRERAMIRILANYGWHEFADEEIHLCQS